MRETYLREEKQILKGVKSTRYAEIDTFQKETSIDLIAEGKALTFFPYTNNFDVSGMFNAMRMYQEYGIGYDGSMPQIFCGKEVTLLNYYGTLYTVDLTNDCLTKLVYENGMSTRERMTFIDGGYNWYLVNSKYVVECNDGTITTYHIGINGGIWFKNRFIFGGFTQYTDLPYHYLAAKSMFTDLTLNSIWWSTVGGGFTSTQFQDTITDYTYLKRFDLGFASVKGTVKKMVLFGDKLVIGTTKAVYLCDVLIGEIITLSTQMILDAGIKDDCIEVVNNTLYIVSDDGSLMVFEGQKFKDLDFQYIFSELSGLYMLKNDKKQELYICNGTVGYVIKGEEVYPLSKSISGLITI